ncbi:MAG: flagellar biosynthesis protein FlhB [Butyricicoccus pullicaecorum]|nr:flagellar biosynthesis protein FlhB [Butyricicoccus pullicaecorum]
MAGADSKTEKATPKKRRDERKKGNIFLSRDIVVVATLLTGFYIIKFVFPMIYEHVAAFLQDCIQLTAQGGTLNETVARELVVKFSYLLLVCGGPVMATAILVTIVATVAQTKPMFTVENLKPKFNRLDPLKGFTRLFSGKSLVEVLKGIIKISILLFMIYRFVLNHIAVFAKTLDTSLNGSTVYLLQVVMDMILQIGMAFIVISAFDFFYQWWSYEKQIRMSKQEIKEEYKQMEGDPQIKGKIKEMQRRMAQNRMMQAVPQADVVVRNPTHFAVALRYDIEKDEAPVVVAKGADHIAMKIVEIAENNQVSVIENRPLARALYAQTEIGQMVPPEHYGAIADILVYVYKLNNRKVIQ